MKWLVQPSSCGAVFYTRRFFCRASDEDILQFTDKAKKSMKRMANDLAYMPAEGQA